MKVVVFGAAGMLGKEVVRALRNSGNNWTAYSHRVVDILDVEQLQNVRHKERPDTVINCAGEPNGGSLVNSLGPHRIARVFTTSRILHVSTDCVFGQGAEATKLHHINDIPRPTDEYGISKLLGESALPHVVNVRTSFIGTDHGLLRWLISNRGKSIAGWSEAWWSGSTAQEVAEELVDLVDAPNLNNIEHLALSRPINKYDLLCMLNIALGLDAKIVKNDNIYINRSLEPTVVLPDIDRSIARLREQMLGTGALAGIAGLLR